MFGEFGPVICAYMLSQSLSQGGVARVVTKLGLRSKGRDGADMAQVENWLLRHGVEKFRAKVGLRQNAHDAPPPSREEENSPAEDSHSSHPHVRPLGTREGPPKATRTPIQVRAVNRTSHRSHDDAPSHLGHVGIKPIGLHDPAASEPKRDEEPTATPPSPPSDPSKPIFPFAPKKTFPKGENAPGPSSEEIRKRQF